jgi:hypothetical protein
MSAAAKVGGERVEGHIDAIWLFPGRAHARRPRRSRRRRREGCERRVGPRRSRRMTCVRHRQKLPEYLPAFITARQVLWSTQARLPDELPENGDAPRTLTCVPPQRPWLTSSFSGRGHKRFPKSGDATLRPGVGGCRARSAPGVSMPTRRTHTESAVIPDGGTDEEERRRTSLRHEAKQDDTTTTARRRTAGWYHTCYQQAGGVFITTTYWYHGNTTIPPTRQEVVSHAIPPLSSRGGAA